MKRSASNRNFLEQVQEATSGEPNLFHQLPEPDNTPLYRVLTFRTAWEAERKINQLDLEGYTPILCSFNHEGQYVYTLRRDHAPLKR